MRSATCLKSDLEVFVAQEVSGSACAPCDLSPFTSSATFQKVFSLSKLLSYSTRRHQQNSQLSQHDPYEQRRFTSHHINSNHTCPLRSASTQAPMADTHATAHQCAVCKEGAALLCPNCATGLNAHGQARKVYYCGKVCQAKDWDAGHKLECKVAVDRRQLFRIGSLVQKVFYQSSKSIWFHGVDKVKKIEHPETEDGPRLLVWLSERSDGPDFPAFPDHLIKDKRNERAMLASAASAVIMMSSFMADLVKGQSPSLCNIFSDCL